jgi:hypothetical protein
MRGIHAQLNSHPIYVHKRVNAVLIPYIKFGPAQPLPHISTQ